VFGFSCFHDLCCFPICYLDAIEENLPLVLLTFLLEDLGVCFVVHAHSNDLNYKLLFWYFDFMSYFAAFPWNWTEEIRFC
jgi:hypothetical protein